MERLARLVQRRVELLARPADPDAFPGGEPVELDDARRPRSGEPAGVRHTRGVHHLLREGLRALDLRRGRARPEHRDPALPQLVAQPGDERRLGADDDQIRAQLGCERPDVGRPHRMAVRERRDAGVAGRRVQLGQRRAARGGPGECVLATARSDDEHLHASSVSGWPVGRRYVPMVEPGLDRHEWESEMQALEDQLGENPAEALPELDRLLERMLEETGYELADPVVREGDEREVVTEFLAAREITRLVEKDADDVGPGDVAAAINGYRAVFDYIVTSRSTLDQA